MATAGVSAQEVDRDWWDCPALPDDLVGIAVVSEDWGGVRWYENPAERDPDTGPLWRRCVPLNPPVVADSSQGDEDEAAPWAVYLVPGLAGGTPPMTMPGAD